MSSVASIVVFATKLAQEVLPLAVKGISSAVALWNEGSAKIAEMVAEKRDPTAEEWGDLNARIGALQSDLHTDDPDEIT